MLDDSLSHRRPRGLNVSGDEDAGFLPTPATSGSFQASVHNVFSDSPKGASVWPAGTRGPSIGQVHLTPMSRNDTLYRIRVYSGRAVGVFMLLVLAYLCLWRVPISLVKRIIQSEGESLQLEQPLGLRVRHTSATTLQVGCFCLSPSNADVFQAAHTQRENIFVHRYHSPITLGPALDADQEGNQGDYLECPASASFLVDSESPKTSPSLCFLVYAKGRALPERLGWEVVRHSLHHPKADHTKWKVMPLEPVLWEPSEPSVLDTILSVFGAQRGSDGEAEASPEVWLDF